jgi:hypothetical protein
MTVNPNLIDTYLFELEAKLKETHVLAVDLLEFAEVGGKIEEALELVRLVRDMQSPPRCMLCDVHVDADNPGEQYICGECLLDPNRRDEINRLIQCTNSSTESPSSAAKTTESDNS